VVGAESVVERARGGLALPLFRLLRRPLQKGLTMSDKTIRVRPDGSTEEDASNALGEERKQMHEVTLHLTDEEYETASRTGPHGDAEKNINQFLAYGLATPIRDHRQTEYRHGWPEWPEGQ
jgi:hypothetical protein